MPMNTDNPDMGRVPRPVLLCLTSYARNRIVDDLQRLVDIRPAMALRVGSLVDSGECGENECRANSRNCIDDLSAYLLVDCKPSANLSAEMRLTRADGELETSANAVFCRQSATDDFQRPNTRLHELEDRGRVRSDVILL